METVRFAVEGMSCEGCARGIVASLKYLEGVQSAQASPDPGEAWVTYDPACVTVDALRHEIEELGYKVTA
jgi:copper chaperone CopZ